MLSKQQVAITYAHNADRLLVVGKDMQVGRRVEWREGMITKRVGRCSLGINRSRRCRRCRARRRPEHERIRQRLRELWVRSTLRWCLDIRIGLQCVCVGSTLMRHLLCAD